MDLSDLDLSVRAFNILLSKGIGTINQLTNHTEEELAIKVDRVSVVEEVKRAFAANSLSFKNKEATIAKSVKMSYFVFPGFSNKSK